MKCLRQYNDKGFTLIEILLVVGLLALVITILLVSINPLRSFNKVKSYETLNGQRELETAINQYYLTEGEWPSNIGNDLRALGTNTVGCTDTYTYENGNTDTSEAVCVDIGSDLIPKYISTIPLASGLDTSNSSGYAVKLENGRPKVYIRNTSLNEVGGEAGGFTTNGVTPPSPPPPPANTAPTISGIVANPIPSLNQAFTAMYTYTDSDNDIEGNHTIAFYQADDNTGINESILSTGTNNTFTPTNAHINKYLRIGMIPEASTGVTPGTEEFSPWYGPLTNSPYQSVGGLIVIKATSEQPLAGSGTAVNTSWVLSSGSDGSNQYYVAEPNVGRNMGDSLQGPRFDYAINFNEAGTYRVFVRMNGPGGTNDSVHVSLDGSPLTYGRYGLTRQGWGWATQVTSRAGPDEVEFSIATPGIHTVSVWMREDGTEYDCLVLKNTGLLGIANPSSNSCPAETGR